MKYLIGKRSACLVKNIHRSVPNLNHHRKFWGRFLSSSIPGLGASSAGGAAPSPGSQEDIKRIKGGVSLYNGSQSTQIPLHTLSSNDISVPVGLSSLNNGLKVNDLGTVAGHDWSLNAGASISYIRRYA